MTDQITTQRKLAAMRKVLGLSVNPTALAESIHVDQVTMSRESEMFHDAFTKVGIALSVHPSFFESMPIDIDQLHGSIVMAPIRYAEKIEKMLLERLTADESEKVRVEAVRMLING